MFRIWLLVGIGVGVVDCILPWVGRQFRFDWWWDTWFLYLVCVNSVGEVAGCQYHFDLSSDGIVQVVPLVSRLVTDSSTFSVTRSAISLRMVESLHSRTCQRFVVCLEWDFCSDMLLTVLSKLFISLAICYLIVFVLAFVSSFASCIWSKRSILLGSCMLSIHSLMSSICD